MNDTPIKTPTLAEFVAAGYVTDVYHDRLHRVAYIKNGKLIVKDFHSSEIPAAESLAENSDLEFGMATLLPKGGKTEVWITDPVTSAEFYAYGICHPHDNYDKKAGVTEALKRIVALMLVTDGVDGFKCRLQL